MSNQYLTPDVIAREALLVLENNLVMANLVHRDYSQEFSQVGDIVTVRKPVTFTAKNFNGSIDCQTPTDASVAVEIDRHRDVSFSVSAADLELDIADFSRELIAPAMRAIAQAIDGDLLNEVAKISAEVEGDDSATNLTDIAKLSKTLDLAKAPLDMRRLVLCPTHKYRYATTDNLTKVANAGDSETLRNAELGKLYTMDTYMDPTSPESAAITPGTATAYAVTGTKGATSVKLTDVVPTTATIKAGDCFILDGYRYYFTADATASSGTITTVAIDCELMDTCDGAEAYVATDCHSLAFHRNAIALVTRPLALPMGADKSAIMEANGIGVRVVFGYDQDSKTDTVSLDVIYGIQTLDESMAVKLVG